jgi:hypothetical protein
LIATEDGHPVGMFTQANALASRDQPRSTRIEAAYDRGDLRADRRAGVSARSARRCASARTTRSRAVCRAATPVGTVTSSSAICATSHGASPADP